MQAILSPGCAQAGGSKDQVMFPSDRNTWGGQYLVTDRDGCVDQLPVRADAGVQAPLGLGRCGAKLNHVVGEESVEGPVQAQSCPIAIPGPVGDESATALPLSTRGLLSLWL